MKTMIQSHRRLFLTGGLLLVALSLAAVLATGCGRGGSIGNIGTYLNAGGKALKALSLSEEDEQEIGKSVAITVTNPPNYNYYYKNSLNEYVTLVGLTVAMGSPRPDREYVFGVLDSSEVGAFSGPGGYIMITRGAIEQMHDEAELAGVLAHEVGHVAKQHGLAAVKQAGVIDAGLEAANTSRELAAFGKLSDDVVADIIKKGYSRTQESEADAEAVTYLINTGYDPRGYVDYMKRIAAKQGSGGSGGLMSTHPDMGERAVEVAAQIDKTGVKGGQRLPERFARNTASLRPG